MLVYHSSKLRCYCGYERGDNSRGYDLELVTTLSSTNPANPAMFIQPNLVVGGLLDPINTSHERSSHQRCYIRKGVLRNFTKFTGKHLYQSLFFNKVAGVKKETLVQVFSCEFCKISKNTFFYRTPLDDCFYHESSNKK